MDRTWPPIVPNKFLNDDYVESPPDNLLKTPAPVEPSKRRRRSTSGVRPFSGSIIMSASEVDAFDDWLIDELANGVFPFYGEHPRTGATKKMRFVDQPRYKKIRPRFFKVMLQLEILPTSTADVDTVGVFDSSAGEFDGSAGEFRG